MYPLRQCSNESSMSAYTYDLLNEFWHAFWLRKRALTQGLAMYYRIDNTDNTLQYIFSKVPIFIQYYQYYLSTRLFSFVIFQVRTQVIDGHISFCNILYYENQKEQYDVRFFGASLYFYFQKLIVLLLVSKNIMTRYTTIKYTCRPQKSSIIMFHRYARSRTHGSASMFAQSSVFSFAPYTSKNCIPQKSNY